MSNRTYICADCRTARRAEAAGGFATSLRCSTCQGPLWELSHKWRIPKKSDINAWAELKEAVETSRPYRDAFIRRRGEDALKKVDRQIEAFSKRKPSSQREEILHDLRKERANILKRYFGEDDPQLATKSSEQNVDLNT